MIKAENLTKYYGQNLAVDNASFEINPGEIVGFLGPNGAGKTTTMRMLTGYLLPTSGKAKVLGMDIIDDSIEIREQTGYLPEMNPVYEEMAIPEYFEFIAAIREMDKTKIESRIREVIKICGLKDVLHNNINELSRGYKQRVGFASAIFHNPSVLILDEPTSGLDPNQAHDVRQLIKEFKKDKTVIISTHILSEAKMMCDRLLIINRGKIVADGTAKELESAYQGKEHIYLEIVSPAEDIAVVEKKIKLLKSYEDLIIKELNTGRLGFEIESSTDLREAVSRLCSDNKWTIIELHRQSITLEEIFRKLTT
ncbi:MAG: hypothetical protein A3J83_01405 [Elusimicrobia bacterium RIFOXYA2_FULL_40_6]|nr:MAG: hypothetical protein A3J83_01405 [Elusimicrobia bacterium RIFOXYA2_FULL_40_6]